MSEKEPIIEKEDEEEKFDISEESAKRQFKVFIRYYDISFEDIEIKDGKEAALTMKNFVVRSIRRGRLQFELVERKLQITHNLDFPTEQTSKIVYKDKVANARVAVNKAEEKDDATMTFMSVLGDIPQSELMQLHGADNTAYSRLSTFFSMV